jgi:endonuclease YncB( thermonuclease family)
MKKATLLLTILLIANALSEAQNTPSGSNVITGRVVKVIDGDSFNMIDKDNKQIRVRLYGIDCPEHGQDFSNKARSKAAECIAGKTVRVIVHDTDRYGRIVGVVPVGKTTLNEILLEDGLAWNYVRYNKHYSGRYGKIEFEAKGSKRGLWSLKDPVAPWDYRMNKSKR